MHTASYMLSIDWEWHPGHYNAATRNTSHTDMQGAFNSCSFNYNMGYQQRKCGVIHVSMLHVENGQFLVIDNNTVFLPSVRIEIFIDCSLDTLRPQFHMLRIQHLSTISVNHVLLFCIMISNILPWRLPLFALLFIQSRQRSSTSGPWWWNSRCLP